MGYSDAMTVTEQAPEIYPGYPYKRRVFPAWQQMWDQLRAAQDYVEGRTLARTVGEEHNLATQTLTAVLARAAAAGLLETKPVTTDIGVTRTDSKTNRTSTFSSTRVYTHYRIADR